MNKRGVAFQYLVIGIIAIIVCVIVIFAFRSIFGKEAGTMKDNVGQTGTDCDQDGVIDLLDRCCDTERGEEVALDGCTGEEQTKVSCKKQRDSGQCKDDE